MPTTDELSDRLDALEARLDEVTRVLMEEKVEALRARIEELEVQMNLGSMDARDQIAPILDQLRNRFLDVRAMIEQASGAAGRTASDLRERVDSTASDLRGRVEDTASRIRPGGDGS